MQVLHAKWNKEWHAVARKADTDKCPNLAICCRMMAEEESKYSFCDEQVQVAAQERAQGRLPY